MELYIFFVSIFGQSKIDTWCENAYWTPKSSNEFTIELCTPVWEETYNYNK